MTPTPIIFPCCPTLSVEDAKFNNGEQRINYHSLVHLKSYYHIPFGGEIWVLSTEIVSKW